MDMIIQGDSDSGLTTAQILRKDFKSTSSATCKVGFSSVTLPLQDVLNRVDLETSLKNFCEHRFLDVNIIMTIDLEGSRQLAIYSEDPNLRETMEERLQGSVLELERIDSTVTNLSAFDQHNGKASRKVVLPLVEEFLRTLDSDSDHEVEEEPGENGVPGNVEELSSNVNNANVMAEDGQQNGKAEVLDTGVRLLPMSPFDKKSISVDESVTKNLEEEWDEKEAILNAIRAKQEEAERRNLQLEDPPSMRQESLDSVDTMRRGLSMDDEWQDDEYSRQALQGNKNGVKKSEEGQSDAFYKRPVPKDERESGDGAEHTIDGRLASDGVILREKKLTRPNSLLNRLSVQSVNSVFSEGSIDLDNISDDDDAEAEKAHNQSKNSGSKDLSGARPKEKRKIRAELSLNLDDAAQHTDDGTTPAILTPTSTEMSWEDDTPMNKAEPIEEYTAREEHEDRWRWRKVNLGGKDYTIDMKAINPYKKVLSHGGYYGEGLNAIIVFASCYLPEKSKKDYTYIMNNLFLYVVSTLELLVAQEYIIIYFHGSASRAKVPSLGWMRKCYQMIDRKLRKSLKGLYLVHPTTWLKAIVQLTKPFISHKFSNKLKFVKSLAELKTLVSMEYVYIPEEVKRFDQNKNKGGGTIWGWIAGPPPVDDEDWFSLEEGYDSDYSITADFLLSPHNPPNWHRRRQRKRLLIKAGNFNFSSDDEAPKEEDADGRRHHRRNQRHHNQQQQPPPPPTSSSHHEDECSVSTPASIGINLGPAISPQDYLTEWYFKRRSQSCSGYIEDDTFSYNHIIETPEVERRTWKDVFGDELGHEDYDGEDEDEGDRNSATESHGQLELSS